MHQFFVLKLKERLRGLLALYYDVHMICDKVKSSIAQCVSQWEPSLLWHENGEASQQNVPLLQFRGGDQTCEPWLWALQPALPPVWILLVDNLDDVTCFEFQTSFLAWYEIIFRWIVVKLSSHVHLKRETQNRHGALEIGRRTDGGSLPPESWH